MDRREFINSVLGVTAGLAVLPVVSKAKESSDLSHLEGEHVGTEYLRTKSTVLDQIRLAIEVAESKDFHIDYIHCRYHIMNQLIFDIDRKSIIHYLHSIFEDYDLRVESNNTVDLMLYCGDIRLAFDINLMENEMLKDVPIFRDSLSLLREQGFPDKYIA